MHLLSRNLIVQLFLSRRLFLHLILLKGRKFSVFQHLFRVGLLLDLLRHGFVLFNLRLLLF